MSRFYGSINGQAQTEATRRGSTSSGISGHVRGWTAGVQVYGQPDRDDPDRDTFEIYATSGSGGAGDSTWIARVVSEGNGYAIVGPDPLRDSLDRLCKDLADGFIEDIFDAAHMLGHVWGIPYDDALRQLRNRQAEILAQRDAELAARGQL